MDMQSDEDSVGLLPLEANTHTEVYDIADDEESHTHHKLRWQRKPFWPALLQRIYHRFLQYLESSFYRPESPHQEFSIRAFEMELRALSMLKVVFKPRFGVPWIVPWSLLHVIVFIIILARSESSCRVPSYDKPVRLSCIDRFWRGTAECGIDGNGCRPFSDDKPFAFRCPANCQTVKVWEPYTVGNITFTYESLIIGGEGNATLPNIYRGDTFICSAAIQSDLFRGPLGGSGIVTRIGEYANFTGKHAHGLKGFDFHSSFPQSFTLSPSPEASCSDPRWALLALSIAYTGIIAVSPASSAVFYGTIIAASYFCTALAADAPEPSSFAAIISLALKGFLPAVFIAYVVYILVIRKTLHELSAPLQRIVLWLIPHWFGALENMSLDLLPLQRLTPHDLAQPGALLVLITITLAIIIAAVGQVWAFHREGRLAKYLIFYGVLATFIGVLASLPGLLLRIHHYILALILLPGTAIQTRPSLVYQGLLMGLFVNGIARWGFDSILQTPSELFGEDFSALVPRLSLPSIQDDTIQFSWSEADASNNVSLSILVNDVERFRHYADQQQTTFNWTRVQRDQDLYFRIGYVREGKVEGSKVGRYSDPGTWMANETWMPIPYP